MEAFMVYMKASLLVGAVLSSPWVFYQLWMFVAAGLYLRERHYVHVFLPFSLGLFIGGVVLAFFAVFPVVLKFLFQFNAWLGIGITPRISEWLSFVLLMPLAFGISFQLPLVMLFLERIGVFTVQSYVGAVARGGVGNLCLGDDLEPLARSLQHADDGVAAGGAVLRRDRAVQTLAAAAETE